MRLTIWGCRGSVPAPGDATVLHGGNTSCVEVQVDDGSVLVLDAGTGLRPLGGDLAARGVRRVHLLLTHLHLDHLEGLRFFAPLWDPGVTVDIWGPSSPVSTLQERIARSFSPPLFPLELRDIRARVTFRDVPREPWSVAGLNLTASLVVHPGPTVGYRLDDGARVVAYIPDHEPALTGIGGRARQWISGAGIGEGADLLFHDAQYFPEEYGDRIGWGHSSVDDAVGFAQAVGARRLVLFHHEPEHSDADLERLEQRAMTLSGRNGLETAIAREGMVVEVP
jgi:phosphoribosyl 1,2-cyclic phosphodiesterase